LSDPALISGLIAAGKVDAADEQTRKRLAHTGPLSSEAKPHNAFARNYVRE
jgi:hypothetical protein